MPEHTATAIVFLPDQPETHYVEEFKDFYADVTGAIKKKIILKVSDPFLMIQFYARDMVESC